MRILLLHADSFTYKVTGETSVSKLLDPIAEEEKAGSAEEVLVSMLSMEKDDYKRIPRLITQAVKEISEHAEKVKCNRIFLYPYAHLSATLESPRSAAKILKLIYEEMDKLGKFELYRAPFGVYKAFDIKVKGHPLSEMGRTITGEIAKDGESSAVKSEKEKVSRWLIITPDGEEHDAEKFNYSKYPVLKKFYEYEMGGDRIDEVTPPHIKLMQEQELVDYEPGSDKGNFRWYPKGYLIKSLLEAHINEILNRYGAMQVETPIMYDFNHAALAKYLDKFPARQYTVSSDDSEYFLRFAACFGQYLMLHDMNISYKHLPLRLYELTHFSFRREQSGELSGLRRLRTFTMPDMHTLCGDMAQAKEEMLRQVDLSLDWMSDIGFESDQTAVAMRAVEDFYNENKDQAKSIAKKAGQPILVEIWDKQYFYFVTKFEVNVVDSNAKASALSTVQIDVENTKGFDVKYINDEGEQNNPLLLHTSVSGSIDRNLYAILEKQAQDMKSGKKAMFPFWLAPSQIRLIPINESHLDFAKDIASKMKGRVDIDDRNETLGKKIRAAEKEWVPLIVVIGDKEMDGDKFPVRVRGQKEQPEMTVEDMNSYFDKETKGKVYKSSNLPKLLSLRAIFRG